MKRTLIVIALGLSALSALSALADEDRPRAPLPPVERVLGESFATSQACTQCHSNAFGAKALRDGQGRGVAPYDLWQSSMMANATRDPLWRAVVSAEVAANPGHEAAIEAKCLRCHAPLAAGELELHPERYGDRPLELALLREEGPLSQLALDGVSCTVCHQIQDEGLGEAETFSGHWVVKPGKVIFGPHDAPFTMPMRRFTGYTPTEGAQLRKPGLCATCHTLFTQPYTASGEQSEEQLPEQTPFLEWRNSNFARAGKTCQSCHVPTRDVDGQAIETRIARNPRGGDFRIAERSPFGRHVFVGGNTLIPGILRDHADELSPLASSQAFDKMLELTREQLQRRTARLELEALERSDGLLTFGVRVRNLTGHKLPTGHPSRRAWLKLRVTDAEGQVLFASGEVDARGRLLGPDGTPLLGELPGGPVHPHRDLVEEAGQVIVYESVMEDTDDQPTWLLTRGARYVKDNRLLPRGWSPDHADAEPTRPRGAATTDADFTGGEDLAHYRVQLPADAGPVTIEASLHYQTLGARYAAELFQYDTPQVQAFRRYYQAADPKGETLATAAAVSD